MKDPEWVYAQMLNVECQLHERLKAIVGAPNHDLLNASAHAYAFGQLQGILDACIRFGVNAPTRPLSLVKGG